jgi:hypothetical protein
MDLSLSNLLPSLKEQFSSSLVFRPQLIIGGLCEAYLARDPPRNEILGRFPVGCHIQVPGEAISDLLPDPEA